MKNILFFILLLVRSCSAMPAKPVENPPLVQPQEPLTGGFSFPIRAAFFYPWFPEAWNQGGMNPFTKYRPAAGFYSQDAPAVIEQQIDAMQYGRIQAGIASWWGVGHHTDQRVPPLLNAGEKKGFSWTLYIESEGQKNPSTAEIQNDLEYIRDQYSSSSAFLKINGRFVVFVYADPGDNCEMVDRWKQGNTVNAYLVLKVFSDYRNCLNQPDGWHQYAPANYEDGQGSYSYTISPGFNKANESAPRLSRGLARWGASIQAMIASQADFQLITTFNEWGEGTAVENATLWDSKSGYGLYLDALHYNGEIPAFVLEDPKYYLPVISKEETSILFSGAGDIGECGLPGAELTAQLLKDLPGTEIFTIGDNAYNSGSTEEFSNCFDPTWGLFKSRIHPAAGNHEYRSGQATGYFTYFGSTAGDPAKGYYSYDLGEWHIIVLNSNCDKVGGCQAGSPQETWLKEDLAAHPNLCTLAYWHHPLYSSAFHGNIDEVQDWWDALYAAGVELVLNGHDHNYERFAPMDPNGNLDPARGIRQMVVGTGGGGLRSVDEPYHPNSEVVIEKTYGILSLVLKSGEYSWKFIPAAGSIGSAGSAGSDSGSDVCHP